LLSLYIIFQNHVSMDFYPPSRKGFLMMLGAIRLGWVGLVLPLARIDPRKEKNLRGKDPGDHKSLKNAG